MTDSSPFRGTLSLQNKKIKTREESLSLKSLRYLFIYYVPGKRRLRKRNPLAQRAITKYSSSPAGGDDFLRLNGSIVILTGQIILGSVLNAKQVSGSSGRVEAGNDDEMNFSPGTGGGDGGVCIGEMLQNLIELSADPVQTSDDAAELIKSNAVIEHVWPIY